MTDEVWGNWVEAVCSNGDHAHFTSGASRVCPDTKCWWVSEWRYEPTHS